MADTLVTLALGILTVACSGLTSAVISHNLNRENQQKVFLRDKAEMLYLATHEYRLLITEYVRSYRKVFDGTYEYNDLMKDHASIGNRDIKYGGLEHINMIVDIYFPSIRPVLKHLSDYRTEFRDVSERINRCLKGGSKVEDALRDRYYELNTIIGHNVDKLLEAIVKEARLQSGVEQ